MAQESIADKKKRAAKIIALLKKQYPDARCSLDFGTVHQLMVATILSAQCTDERVNMVTPALFERYTTVKDFAEANTEELEQLIYTTGFFRAKAKAIKQSAQQLMEQHGGEIPPTLEELVRLQGVGRKTASVILGAGFGLAEGVVVDTHVGRISRKLGLTRKNHPAKIERDLMALIDKDDWIAFSHLLIYHGRAICTARSPRCGECPVRKLCPGAEI
ncbi:endonuclease III [candidate division GN15 bacterium]|uniref:Endonuclease III n=1 Tax=candidate division GN15 bacterium TaxID=2072418 RepID=A0A855WZ33_9BACT|nr:MAG: endonuclease III [candidate division GN15 bacterium]